MTDEPVIDGEVVTSSSPRCAFLQQRGPDAAVIDRCQSVGNTKVLVPVKSAGGMFFGAGIVADVCRVHANELLERYYARLPV